MLKKILLGILVVLLAVVGVFYLILGQDDELTDHSDLNLEDIQVAKNQNAFHILAEIKKPTTLTKPDISLTSKTLTVFEQESLAKDPSAATILAKYQTNFNLFSCSSSSVSRRVGSEIIPDV